MKIDNMQEAAFLVVKGHAVQSVSFNPSGWGVIEFDDSALPDRAAFKMDAPVPCRTYLKTYKAIIRRVEEERQAQRVGAPGSVGRG